MKVYPNKKEATAVMFCDYGKPYSRIGAQDLMLLVSDPQIDPCSTVFSVVVESLLIEDNTGSLIEEDLCGPFEIKTSLEQHKSNISISGQGYSVSCYLNSQTGTFVMAAGLYDTVKVVGWSGYVTLTNHNLVAGSENIVNDHTAETPVSLAHAFVQDAVRNGFPSQISLRFTGTVDWSINGVWCRDVELRALPPYASPITDDIDKSVKELWVSAINLIDFIQPRPFENMAGYEAEVEAAEEMMEELKASIEANPYQSLHVFNRSGVTVSAELHFKP